MVQQENYTADGLTAKNLIAKDASADLPEPSKFAKRRQLNCCTLLFDLSDVVQLTTVLTPQFEHELLVVVGSKGH